MKALITGGSRGIGAACARKLASMGIEVIINYKNSRDQAVALAKELGGTVYCADVGCPEAVSKMFEDIGGIDILVCNAGISITKLITDTTYDEWREIFAVNTDSVFTCCKAALPHMIRNHFGKIITISSVWGVTGASCEVAYSASKAAVIGFTKALAKEVGPSNITVNCVAPGVIYTDMNAMHSEEVLQELAEETPLCRIGTAAQVADAVGFLASSSADFITGEILNINGGFNI